jgi:hypothetical protein
MGNGASGATKSHRVAERGSILWENCASSFGRKPKAGGESDHSDGATIAAPELTGGKGEDSEPEQEDGAAFGEKEDEG